MLFVKHNLVAWKSTADGLAIRITPYDKTLLTVTVIIVALQHGDELEGAAAARYFADTWSKNPLGEVFYVPMANPSGAALCTRWIDADPRLDMNRMWVGPKKASTPAIEAVLTEVASCGGENVIVLDFHGSRVVRPYVISTPANPLHGAVYDVCGGERGIEVRQDDVRGTLQDAMTERGIPCVTVETTPGNAKLMASTAIEVVQRWLDTRRKPG